MGATHQQGLMASANMRAMHESTFKRVEREVGKHIENVARESCSTWKALEQETSQEGQLKGSYDFGWQKNKRAHNSKTGQGTVVGYETGKCIDFYTRNAPCRKCNEGARNGKPALPHDCRKNHEGSSKAMEASAAVELFGKGGYSVLIGDDDSSVISRVRAEVDEGIQKWSDINHAICTFKRGLYEVRGIKYRKSPTRFWKTIPGDRDSAFRFIFDRNWSDVLIAYRMPEAHGTCERIPYP
ncbi:hypothetical protein QZH41_001336 [Actinostola sp. cb2023]|nr:hypothetical protein QZH41_001336 [Actinostola sp. cb2023]